MHNFLPFSCVYIKCSGVEEFWYRILIGGMAFDYENCLNLYCM
jgi:hypothetical protein